jgi:hypothetical protein
VTDVLVTDDTDVVISAEPSDDVVVIGDFEAEVIEVPEQGPPGPAGAPGTPGTNGNTILYGPGDPSPGQGRDGDFYINTTTHMMFGPKASGLWPATGTSLVGPQGPAGVNGNTVLYGAGPPSSGTGVDGNFYIDTTAHFIYGPKASGAWPAGTSMVGPQGPAGVAGAAGNTVLYGSGPPSSGTGVDGNFYIDTTAHFIYGPKASGAWPAGTSLIGPQGPAGVAGPSGLNVVISDTPPGSPTAGTFWWNSTNGQLYLYYNDGTSSQWVFASYAVNQPQVVRSHLAGLDMSTAGGSTTMTVAAGIAADSGNVDMISIASPIGKTTAVWAVGSGNGGLDTGSIAANTWYHFFVIKRPDTQVTDVLFSLSPSAPTMPASYTLKRRIGTRKTNASSQWIAFSQNGDEVLLAAVAQDVAVGAGGVTSTAAAFTLASIPTGIKVNALIWGSLNASVAWNGAILSPDNGGTTFFNFNGAAAQTSSQALNVRTNTSGQVMAFTSSSGSMNIWTTGWIDRRGRDA